MQKSGSGRRIGAFFLDSLILTFGSSIILSIFEDPTYIQQQVDYAITLANQNEDVDTIVEKVYNKFHGTGEIVFIPDSLLYLKRGGRISPAIAAIANLIGVIPILTFKDGEVGKKGVTRTAKKAFLNAISEWRSTYSDLAENYDILLCDTAGRLQTKVNLMNELSKMKRVLQTFMPDAPHETLLVIDATTGQNGMSQAKAFKEATDVSGIVLTKLDGTSKGGIVLAIRHEMGIPIKYIGLGEAVDDLEVFDIESYLYGLFADFFED